MRQAASPRAGGVEGGEDPTLALLRRLARPNDRFITTYTHDCSDGILGANWRRPASPNKISGHLPRSVFFHKRSNGLDSAVLILKWLTLTDAGDYARSWDAAAALFQASISKPNWATALANARQPLGGLISRFALNFRYVSAEHRGMGCG
jgi:hypothetical protein